MSGRSAQALEWNATQSLAAVYIPKASLSLAIDPFLDAFRVFIGGQNRSQIRRLILQQLLTVARYCT